MIIWLSLMVFRLVLKTIWLVIVKPFLTFERKAAQKLCNSVPENPKNVEVRHITLARYSAPLAVAASMNFIPLNITNCRCCFIAVIMHMNKWKSKYILVKKNAFIDDCFRANTSLDMDMCRNSWLELKDKLLLLGASKKSYYIWYFY